MPRFRLAIAAVFLGAGFSHVLVAASDQVRGSLVITVADYFAEGRSEIRYLIKEHSQPERTVELLFATKVPDGLRTGMIVTARGHISGKSLESADIIATESAKAMSPRSTGLAGMSLPTITPASGVQNTLIYVLVSATSQNNFTTAQVSNAMFAQTGLSVNTLYQEVSFGSMSHVGKSVGPYTITDPTTCEVPTDIFDVQSQADLAATAEGVDISAYPHHIYMMPNEMAKICTAWGGVSLIGGNPGLSWINTGLYSPPVPPYDSTDIYVVLAHEFGHQLSMMHSQAIQANGSLIEYGDNSCFMGDELYNVVGLDVPHLIQLGWIPLSNILQVSASGTYQVAFAEQQSSAAQALEIVPPGTTDTLYVSYRQPQGADPDLLLLNDQIPSVFEGGASIQFWNGSGNISQSKSQLATFFPYGGALADGQTYTAPNGNLTITQVSHTSTNVTLAVEFLGSSVGAIGAITNAASFTANSLSPGSIATIFGTNLATSTAQAEAVPLPTSLGFATIAVNGVVAPIIYASPLQINFQIPNEVSVGTASVVVDVGGGTIIPFSATVQAASPGIFQFGSNRAVAQNPDNSLNNSSNPVVAGGYITAYLTGIGPLDNPVADGAATPQAPLACNFAVLGHHWRPERRRFLPRADSRIRGLGAGEYYDTGADQRQLPAGDHRERRGKQSPASHRCGYSLTDSDAPMKATSANRGRPWGGHSLVVVY